MRRLVALPQEASIGMAYRKRGLTGSRLEDVDRLEQCLRSWLWRPEIVHHSSMPVDFEDVLRAASRLEGVATRTPVFTSRTANALAGCSLYFKAEGFQRGGAFKMRGAYNAIASLSPRELRGGVVTFSSGNHAAAVALAASLLGTTAIVVMPKDAPTIKVASVQGYGADIVFYDRAEENREAHAARIAEERGATIIPPYDNERVIAGAGTAAKELIDEVGELDALIVPCGGGGLISGSAISTAALSSGGKVFGVEPEAGDDAKRSFESGKIQVVHDPITIADGARTPSVGRINFEIIQRLVAGFVTVTDAELVRAMRFVMERMKIVVEPTGVLAAAAAFERKLELQGQKVGVILSGSNVDLSRAANLIEQYG